jgi:hypothetical protein
MAAGAGGSSALRLEVRTMYGVALRSIAMNASAGGVETMACPACGGSGGGPFGRAGTGWDVESYECVRCMGEGVVSVRDEEMRAAAVSRPGVAKAREASREAAPEKKSTSQG